MTPADHAATVPISLAMAVRGNPEATADLQALAERATELEREAEQLRANLVLADATADVAEARATELERERDRARNDAALLKDEGDMLLRNVRRLEKKAERAESSFRRLVKTARDRRERAERAETALQDAAKALSIAGKVIEDARDGFAPTEFALEATRNAHYAARVALGETAP